MARRPGTRWRWLIVAATPWLLAAGVPPEPPRTSAPSKAEMKHPDPTRSDAAAPDPALLDYLGRYGGAADDVDPLGLVPDQEPAPPPAAGKERR